MEILERPIGSRAGCASLSNIGYGLFEVNLEGEVYKYGIPSTSECCKAEHVGDRWKIRKYDDSGNMIERVMRTDVLVGCAWYNIDQSLWENSTYADTIYRCKKFFSIPDRDKAKTIYQTNNGFSYYVTRFGEVWNTETMTKLGIRIDGRGYRQVNLGSEHNVSVHRLVARYFVPVPKDLVDQGLNEESLVVNHLDGNKLNNRWDNLEWTTQKGNVEHACINGLIPTIIDDQLLERVWQLLQAGYSDINISRETGIPSQNVRNIRHGTSFRYRTDKYTWPKYSPGVREEKRRDELTMKCVQMYNQGMTHKAIADKLGFKCRQTVATLIGTCRDLITRKLPPKLDRDTIFSIYDKFMYTDKSNSEIARQYNVSDPYIYYLRTGRRCSDLAREYVTSKGLAGYWQGFSPPK